MFYATFSTTNALKGLLVAFALVFATAACDSGSNGGNEAKPQETFMEQYAPGRNGEVRQMTVAGETITYEYIDGHAVIEGDIVYESEEELRNDLEFAAEEDANISIGESDTLDLRAMARMASKSKRHWPNGEIPYEIDTDSWPNDDTVTCDIDLVRTITTNTRDCTIRKIYAAINHFEDETGLRFYEATSGRRIRFFKKDNKNGCWSNRIGRRRGLRVRLNKIHLGNCSFVTVVHEIGHAIGMFHEQQRSDRNQFIDIHWENIERKKGQYRKRKWPRGSDRGTYDYKSIMHYPDWAFCKTPCPPEGTMTPLITGATIGPRDGLSEGDLFGIYWVYGEDPNITITHPQEGETIGNPDSPNNRSLTVDAEDWGGKMPRIVWYSGTERLGTGNYFRPDLEAGAYTLTAQAIDIVGRTAEAIVSFEVREEELRAYIQSPAPTSDIYRDVPVSLIGYAGGYGGTSATCRWTSSNASDPFPVDGCDVDVVFPSTGSRTLTLTVSEGSRRANADVTINVQESPDLLLVIDSPEEGSSYQPGRTITLSAHEESDTGRDFDYVWRAVWPYDPDTGEEGGNDVLVGVGREITWTPEDSVPEDCPGEILVRLIADDGGETLGTATTFVSVCQLY